MSGSSQNAQIAAPMTSSAAATMNGACQLPYVTRKPNTIGDRAPVAMQRKVRSDPFVAEVFARNEATKKPWIKAEPSSHMWVARLPGDLGAGTHRVIVEARTETPVEALDQRQCLQVMRPNMVETRLALGGLDRLGDGFHIDAFPKTILFVDGPCFPSYDPEARLQGLRSV